jgi:hypothetical protein
LPTPTRSGKAQGWQALGGQALASVSAAYYLAISWLHVKLGSSISYDMQRLKIFLASSSELKSDREQFEISVNRKNKSLINKGIFLDLVIWEDFLDALAPDGLQKEYNKAIRNCDLFVMLYFTKVGKYTAEEFETAIGAFKEGGRPLIFTYFKDAAVSTGSVRREDMQSLWAFQDKLHTLGHYQTVYVNTQDLLWKFDQQLDKLMEEGKIFTSVPNTHTSTPSQQPTTHAQPTTNEPPKHTAQPTTHETPKQPATSTEKNYHLGNIIRLLTQAFDATAFETFALIHFEQVHRQFSPGMSQSARIQLLVTFARNHGKMEDLLAAVKAENVYQYEKNGPYAS